MILLCLSGHAPAEVSDPVGKPGRDLLRQTLARVDSLIPDWQFAAAESLCARERADAIETWGAASFEAADVRLRQVRLARTRGDSSALALSGELVRDLRASVSDRDPRLVPALLEYAQALKKPARYDEASSILDECFRITTEATPVDSLLLARTLQDRAALLMERRDQKTAEAPLRQAYEIRRRILGEENRDTAWSRLYLAILEFQTGRRDEAAHDYEAAVSTVAAVEGRRHADYLWALNAWASFLQSHGDLKTARDDYEYILRVRRERGAPEDANLAWTINSLAIICEVQVEFSRAESLYAEALRIRRAQLGEDHWLIARSLTNCGKMMFYRGELLESRELLEQALAIFRKHQMDKDTDAGLCLLDLGTMHEMTGDMETARDYFERAGAVFHANRYARAQDVMASLVSLGSCYLQEGAPARAEPFFRAALDTALARFPDSRWAGWARIDLAGCLSAQKRTAEADAQFAQGLSALEHSPDANAYDLGSALCSAGQDRLARGQFRKAAADFRRSIDLTKEDLEPSHPHLIQCWIGLAEAAAGSGQFAGARELALRAHELEMRHLHENIGYMTERHALLYRAALESAADVAVSVIAAAPAASQRSLARTWEAVLNGRVLVLDELIARGREERNCPAGERQALDALVAAKSRLANLYVRAASNHMDDKYGQLLDKAVREREAAEKTLASKIAHRKTTDRKNAGYRRVALSRVLARLPENSVLVAYVRYQNGVPTGVKTAPEAYGAFIAPRAGGITFVPLGDADSIDRSVEAWRAHLMQAANQLRTAPGVADSACFNIGDRLRRLVWDPIVPRLGSAAKVIVVPDGLLHMVSIPALPLDRSRFVLEQDRLVCVMTAEKDLLRPVGRSGEGLLAMGDPDFNTSAPPSGRRAQPVALALRGGPGDCRGLDNVSFDRLPGTGDEVRNVAALWRSARGRSSEPLTLVGPAAAEGAFKKLAPGRRVIHIATHGFFMAEECAPLPQSISRRLSGAGLRAGLALAGANARTHPDDSDDGILTAEEIGALDLSGVQTAVLSACNSGQGEVAGEEGIFGLRRAFQAAGVHDLVMSLWPVGDRGTGEWMEIFYRQLWVNHAGAAEAARAASLGILEKRRRENRDTHPFYWGSFITVGDN